MKKLIALVLALAMVALCAVAFAEGPQPNDDGTMWQGDTQYDTTWNDSGTGTTHAAGTLDQSMTISGLKLNDEVKFFKVLGYSQDATSTVAAATTTAAGGWEVVAPFNAGDNKITLSQFKDILTTGIDAELAGQIAKNVDSTPDYSDTATTEVTSGSGNYKVTINTPEAGLYVAIITSHTAGIIYNPVFVGVDYYTRTGGDQSSNWVLDTAMSYSDNAMAKKSEITLTKEATENHEDDNEKLPSANANNDAKAAAVGDQINFTVKTTIPQFSSNYTNPVFVINDVMTSGLDLTTSTVKVYSATVSEGVWTKGDALAATAYSIPAENLSARGYKIVFDKDYLLGLTAPQNIIVEYSAVINEKSVENVNEEDNTVTLVYSHDPSVTTEANGTKLRDKTHHYSFTIDGNIWGSDGWKTTEVVKVGLDKEGNEITQTTTLHGDNKIGALAGAEFKLYVNSGCTTEYNKGAYAASSTIGNEEAKIISDSEGRLKLVSYPDGYTAMGIPGLDAGTYWLKEVKAPDGYIKQQAAVKIEIIPEYYPEITWTDSDGVQITANDLMKSYTVKIDDKVTATYTLNYLHMNTSNTQPTDDVITETEGMKTTAGDLVIGNSGPITTVTVEQQESDEYGKIKNTQGVELPSTGGIGTTLFYVIGGLLVIGAAVVLVARRKAHE